MACAIFLSNAQKIPNIFSGILNILSVWNYQYFFMFRYTGSNTLLCCGSSLIITADKGAT